MIYPIGTKEEMQIIQDVESGKFVPLNSKEMEEMKHKFVSAAKNTNPKTNHKKSLNLRKNENLIEKIEALEKV